MNCFRHDPGKVCPDCGLDRTNDKWLTNWTSTPVYEEEAPISKDAWTNLKPTMIAWDLGIKDSNIIDKTKNLKQEGSNLVDSTGNLYFQCETCGDLFDPETTSFKVLHEKTKMLGWLIKWNSNGQGYKIYCVGCKEGV